MGVPWPPLLCVLARNPDALWCLLGPLALGTMWVVMTASTSHFETRREQLQYVVWN
jgi:hypothetical protein